MSNQENLLDEISIEQIREKKIDGVSYQDVRRKKLFGEGKYHSTSFFINKNTLLTSAHNVVKSTKKVTKIYISPSRLGEEFHQGTVEIDIDYSKNIRIAPSYTMNWFKRSTRKSQDLAIIYLPDQEFETNPQIQQMPFLPILEDMSSISIGENVYCAGYPASEEHTGRHKMTLDKSFITDIKDQYFRHNLDTRTGNSGSPIMVKRDGVFFVIGVNSIKYYGTLINDNKKSWIENSIQDLRNSP